MVNVKVEVVKPLSVVRKSDVNRKYRILQKSSQETAGTLFSILGYPDASQQGEFMKALNSYIVENYQIEIKPSVAYITKKSHILKKLLILLTDASKEEISDYKSIPTEWLLDIAQERK